MQPARSSLPVFPVSPIHEAHARLLGERYGLLFVPHEPVGRPALRVGSAGLSLVDGSGRFRPLSVEFVRGAAGYRHRHGGGVDQALARAVGARRGKRPEVLDATAGLGRDGFVLAALGCTVRMLERSGALAALLADGLERAARDAEVGAWLRQRITLRHADSTVYMQAAGHGTDVVYLDPMYPRRRKAALPERNMQLLREVAGEDADSAELLAAALGYARYRVVIKRPRGSPPLGNKTPDFSIRTRHTRYDVHLPAATLLDPDRGA